MKALKKILFSLLSVCMAGSFVFAAACGGGNGGGSTPPSDGGSSSGSSDGGNTCNHDDTIVCGDCGAVVQGDGYYVNFAESVVGAIGAAKGYKLDLAGTKVTLDTTAIADALLFETNYIDTNDEWQTEEIKMLVAEAKSGEAFIGFDEDYALYATGEAVLEMQFYTATDKEFSNVAADASFTFEGTKLTATLVTDETYVGLSAELQAINNYEERTYV